MIQICRSCLLMHIYLIEKERGEGKESSVPDWDLNPVPHDSKTKKGEN